MSAREQILGDVRRALAGAGEPAPVSRVYRTVGAPTPAASLVDLFAARVEDYRASVHRVSEPGFAERVGEILAGLSVVVPEGLPFDIEGAVLDTRSEPLSANDLDGLDAVVTTASVAIAETGTIVLEHGPGQGRHALSLVPDLHVCVVRADQVVPGVVEAVAALDPLRAQTWISGPSATSDIELDRVEGVHGPRTLHVVVVGR